MADRSGSAAADALRPSDFLLDTASVAARSFPTVPASRIESLMPASTDPPRDNVVPPTSRAEWIAIAVILACAIVVRCAVPNGMAVEHFDEGVYASNLFSGPALSYEYPFRDLYAPPLLPTLIEIGVWLLGPASLGPMLVNLVAGCLTVLLLWRVGRAWFGPAAGATAAALCAFSDFHVLYSRTALTDPLLGLTMLAAVYAIWRTHLSGDARWGLAAALAAGAAWWTKYNGWLPLAVGLSGVAAWQCFTLSRERAVVRHAGVWLGIALATAAVWSPVWIGLQSAGGYSVVASNHRQYLVGFPGWPDSLVRHFQVHRHFDGWLTIAGFAVATAGVAFLARAGQRKLNISSLSVAAVGLAVAGFAAVAGSVVPLAVLAACGIAAQTGLIARGAASSPAGEVADARRLAAWLLAAWFVGLLLATPLYRPYPRLSLPWLIAAWLGCGAFAAFAIRFTEQILNADSSPLPGRRPIVPFVMAVAGVGLLVLSGERLTRHEVPGWQRRDALVSIADDLLRRASEEATTGGSVAESVMVIYVFGEPGLFYQLAAAAPRHPRLQYVVAPVSSLEFPPARSGGKPVTTLLVVGPHARRTAGFEAAWNRHAGRFQRVGPALPYRASDLVLLNEWSPSEITGPDSPPPQEIELFRLRE